MKHMKRGFALWLLTIVMLLSAFPVTGAEPPLPDTDKGGAVALASQVKTGEATSEPAASTEYSEPEITLVDEASVDSDDAPPEATGVTEREKTSEPENTLVDEASVDSDDVPLEVSGVTEADVKEYIEAAVTGTFAGYSLNTKHFYPLYGKDTNAVDTVAAMLAEKGYGDIEVTLHEGDTFSSKPSAAVNDDGTIVYMKDDFANPAGFTNMTYRQLQTDYTFSKAGFSFTYRIKTHVAWDIDDIVRQFEPIAETINEAYIQGDNSSLAEMSKPIVLYGRPDEGKISWINIKWSWQPDDSANQRNVTIKQRDPFQPFGAYDVTFNHKETDITGRLVADFEVVKAGEPKSRLGPIDTFKRQKSFAITIPGRSLTDELNEALRNVDLSKVFIADLTPATPVDPAAVTTDLRFANWRELGISSTNRQITYISSNPEVIGVNYFRANVLRPQPGDAPVNVTLSVKLTHRPSGQSVVKEIGEVTVLPLDLDLVELRQAEQAMKLAIAGYRQGLMGDPDANTDPDNITKDLHNFAEVHMTPEGDIAWIRSYEHRDFKSIAAVEIDPATTQEQWRLFRSDRPDVIEHEVLRLREQPLYDTTVTIDSVLSHQVYEKYAPTLDPADDSEVARILRFLHRQPVSAVFKVPGKSGPNPHEGQISVTFRVIGSKPIFKQEDHATAHESWFDEAVFVEPGTTLGQLTETLLNRPDEGFQLINHDGFISSITVPDKGTNTYQLTNGIGSSWMWFTEVDGELIEGQVMASGYNLKDGDHVVWKFINDAEYPFEVLPEEPEEPIVLQPTPDHWTGFGKDNDNNALFETEAVTVGNKRAAWQKQIGEPDMWGTSYNSDYLILGDHLIVANGKALYKLDKNGNIVAETTLRASIKYFARLAYDNGLIIVPLGGGAMQAVRFSDMETVWVAEAMKYLKWAPVDQDDPAGEWAPKHYHLQNLSTTYIADRSVYSATAAVEGLDSIGGYLRSIDMATGRTRWLKDIPGGFYWSGPVQIESYLVIAGEDGVLRALDTETGKEVAKLSIGAKVRSTIVHRDGYLFFTDIDGHLHRAQFENAEGSVTFKGLKSVKFSEHSTSTPAVHNGLAYVGGRDSFVVIDIDQMTITKRFELEHDVQATPLVISGSTGVKVYFTMNGPVGGLLVFDGTNVTTAYEPPKDAQNYTTSSAVIDQQGTIYYTNDSGFVFALQDPTTEALLTVDVSLLANTALQNVAINRVDGQVLNSGVIKFTPEVNKELIAIGDAQFGKQRSLLLDISLFGDSDARVLSEGATVVLDLTLSGDFIAETKDVQLFRFDKASEKYAVVMPTTLTNGVMQVTFDSFSPYALVATPVNANTDPSETTPTESVPEETKPQNTDPQETTPTQTEPEPTTPTVTQPDDTTPVDTETNTDSTETVVTTPASTQATSPPSDEVPRTGEDVSQTAIYTGGVLLLLAAALIVAKKKISDE